MGFWSWITGTGTADKALDVVSEGASLLDKAFYTDEEKAEGAKDLLSMWMRMRESNSIKTVTRRLLAVTFAGLYSLLFLVGGGFVIANRAYIAEALVDFAVKMFFPHLVLTVMIYYFGPWLLDVIIRRFVKGK